MTKNEIKLLRIQNALDLGHKFPLLLDYDQDELVRNAIFEYNRLFSREPLTDEIIGKILETIDRKAETDEEKLIFVINNKESRKRGLHAILGSKLFNLINKDGNLRGALTVFAKDIRLDRHTEVAY